MGLDPKKWQWPRRGYAVLVRVYRPGDKPVVYPGIVVHSAKTWTKMRSCECGWVIGINRRDSEPRVAVALEVAPGIWQPHAANLRNVARPGCVRLQSDGWQAALERGLPFIRGAIYSRDVPASELYSRGGPVAEPVPRPGPARSPFARRRLPAGSCW